MSMEHTIATASLGDFSRVDSVASSELISKLDKMHTLHSFQDYKNLSFRYLNLVSGSRVADVGCGTGDDAAQLAQIVGFEGLVTGYDLSEKMVNQARTRHEKFSNLEFRVAESERLATQDHSLDAIRADRVLTHVPCVDRTLDEMLRVLRPGGRIVISEPDMPGAWIASGNDKFSNLVIDNISRSCANTYVARNLFTLFKDRALTNVEMNVNPIVEFNIDVVNKIFDISSVVASLVKQSVIKAPEAEQWLKELSLRASKSQFVAGLCVFTLAGTKI